MNWPEKCEEVLATIGLPYYFQHAACDAAQLPDSYIVYYLMHDSGSAWENGKETSHEARIRICLYFRDKSVFVEIPEKIEKSLMEAGFGRRCSRSIRYQIDTAHYGWRCDFNYYERR